VHSKNLKSGPQKEDEAMATITKKPHQAALTTERTTDRTENPQVHPDSGPGIIELKKGKPAEVPALFFFFRRVF